MQPNEVKRWRFCVENLDEECWYLDAAGGVNGNERDAEFIGTSQEAEAEGERRCELWETATGDLAARITRESCGAPNTRI